MPEIAEPFTGTWKFNATRSQLDTPSPLTWTQEIVVTSNEIVVQEDIVRSNGIKSKVRVWARFDGTDYPVTDLPIADFMAYRRNNSHSISGVGKKDGMVSLNETVTISPNGMTLTLIYSIQMRASPVTRGVAVFDREPGW